MYKCSRSYVELRIFALWTIYPKSSSCDYICTYIYIHSAVLTVRKGDEYKRYICTRQCAHKYYSEIIGNEIDENARSLFFFFLPFRSAFGYNRDELTLIKYSLCKIRSCGNGKVFANADVKITAANRLLMYSAAFA